MNLASRLMALSLALCATVAVALFTGTFTVRGVPDIRPQPKEQIVYVHMLRCHWNGDMGDCEF